MTHGVMVFGINGEGQRHYGIEEGGNLTHALQRGSLTLALQRGVLKDFQAMIECLRSCGERAPRDIPVSLRQLPLSIRFDLPLQKEQGNRQEYESA